MGAFHEAGCWTIWTRCVQNDWWQMPYKYQTWHDWHDDHNGNFPELNGGSKDHIFFLGLTNYTIYIYILCSFLFHFGGFNPHDVRHRSGSPGHRSPVRQAYEDQDWQVLPQVFGAEKIPDPMGCSICTTTSCSDRKGNSPRIRLATW
jgi:hypothetical protein